MNVLKLARKYPQFGQDGIFALQDTFNRCDEEGRGYLDEAAAIKTAQQLERKQYDEVRAALKQVELDSSRRVELDDFVDVGSPAPSTYRSLTLVLVDLKTQGAGVIAERSIVQGTYGFACENGKQGCRRRWRPDQDVGRHRQLDPHHQRGRAD